jgi:hypothetical protein
MELSFSQLSPTNHNATLEFAAVSTCCSGLNPTDSSDCSSVISETVSVAKIVAANPKLQSEDVNSAPLISSDAWFLTVQGSGFSAEQGTFPNTIEFAQYCDDNTNLTCVHNVKGTMVNMNTTMNTLVVQFTHLAPTDQSVLPLQAQVTVSNTWSSTSMTVAKVTATNPTIDSSTTILSSDALRLTVYGRGFDAFVTTSNVLNIDVIQGEVARSSVTALILSFTRLSPTDTGPLYANVTVTSTWSHAESTQIANIVQTNPSLDLVNLTVLSDSPTITLRGRGFDASVRLCTVTRYLIYSFSHTTSNTETDK